MSAKRDYYEILGINKTANADEIKKAYRKLALRYHPDRVASEKKKEAEEEFKEVSEAYAVLSDEKKRALYDQYGHAGIDQKYSAEDIFRGADFSSIFGGADLESVFGNIFGDFGFDIFGASSRGRTSGRGRDLQLQLDISLEEAAFGATKSITVPRYESCAVCAGSGAKPGTKRKTCSQCKGQGQILVSGGFFRMSQTCPKCRGEGTIITSFCPECNGQGRVKKKRSLEVKIPAGVETGSHLRLKGEGEQGRSVKGDLYIIINVSGHDKFVRQGNDIICEVAISMPKAVLGAEIEVPTLDGRVSMKIPPGTQPGKIFRLRGKGVVDLHSYAKGDQLVKIQVEIPVSLNSEQKKLMEEFARITGEDAASGTSFTEKIKKAFK
ncbi:MAG: molecular chaperone DnaJ [Candidatus Omnitrophica bacterium CG11_big_fil_rev_8_21_14_0_20_42_13]|uniref:Chaperone protein DnaJ n=1 Tax=Candidatus Ghiorseimicrobium undicola TaxID=1974746 RepID=A0A2H0LV88_9BACT|nr:MAG: molecular chaperone DnaJ [Candidatus Omnitrophica bacterium CG11_big_fil_rev_8_21_14_0_20_42_13]